MAEVHECRPDDHSDAWKGSGWEGTSYHCPGCGTDWFVDVSYKGPGYQNPTYYWDHW